MNVTMRTTTAMGVALSLLAMPADFETTRSLLDSPVVAPAH